MPTRFDVDHEAESADGKWPVAPQPTCPPLWWSCEQTIDKLEWKLNKDNRHLPGMITNRNQRRLDRLLWVVKWALGTGHIGQNVLNVGVHRNRRCGFDVELLRWARETASGRRRCA